MTTRRAQSGFALPMTLFLIAIVTLMLTAAFSKVSADRRVGDASGANVSAMSIAKSALQNYLGTRTTRPADGDSVRVNVTGGYADVIAQVMRRPVDPLANWLFVVRSVGHVIDPTQGSDPQAVRTIAQFAQWQTGQIDVLSALTEVDGFNSPGSSPISISGIDSTGCGAATTAGIYTKNGEDPSLPGGSVSGSPLVYEMPSGAKVDTATHIDWTAIRGGGFATDYNQAMANDTTFSSQYYSGSATLTNLTGTGLLIVGSTLTLNGVTRWSGIILVGNHITFGATASPDSTFVQGMVVLGLNNSGAKGNIGAQPLTITYNSCNIRKTMARLTGFAPITNGWVDNWATY